MVEDRLVAGEALEAHHLLGQERAVVAELDVPLARNVAEALVEGHGRRIPRPRGVSRRTRRARRCRRTRRRSRRSRSPRAARAPGPASRSPGRRRVFAAASARAASQSNASVQLRLHRRAEQEREVAILRRREVGRAPLDEPGPAADRAVGADHRDQPLRRVEPAAGPRDLAARRADRGRIRERERAGLVEDPDRRRLEHGRAQPDLAERVARRARAPTSRSRSRTAASARRAGRRRRRRSGPASRARAPSRPE